MRPVRVTVEGFASYRSAVTLDLVDVDFFSLTGATGSGKSSLIDAMVFALYGKVPRLGMRSYAPIVNVGADRARVAFDFEVGAVAYSVARLVERTKGGGAVVKEARLQMGDKTLADGADDVTAAVEDLLRLEMADFTRTVVLPQGDFAAFLEAPKGEKQALLKSILGLDLYGRVRSLAKERESIARAKCDQAQSQLREIVVPDVEIRDQASLRLEALRDLGIWMQETDAILTSILRDQEIASSALRQLDDDLERLGNVTPPDLLDELDEMTSTGESRLAEAAQRETDANRLIPALESAIHELPSEDVMKQWLQLHAELGEIDISEAEEAVAQTQTEVAEITASLTRAVSNRTAIEAELQALHREHSAHALAGSLVGGEPCPVCRQPVEKLPDRSPPEGLTDLEDSLETQSLHIAEMTEALDRSKISLARVEATQAAMNSARSKLLQRLERIPTAQEIADRQIELSDASKNLEQALKEQELAASEMRRASRDLEDLAESTRSVRLGLMNARESVATLKPPELISDDVMVLWKELLSWRDSKLESVQNQRQDVAAEVQSFHDRAETLVGEIGQRLHELDVPAVEPYSTAVAVAIEKAEHEVKDLADRVKRATNLEQSIDTLTTEAGVAATLAKHLQTNYFEKWLLVGAIANLVEGANGRLAQLSDSTYSLQSDDEGSFTIIDHRNADQTRPVATLSGGETFLVSLALALSLAETLAGVGGADLDAIILDEGFGTLDEEMLDTVASVLEDLAGTLMVGVITHVKDLAERASVRFEVTREPDGSKVRKVS